MKPRTRARSIALQALYEIDIAQHDTEYVLTERLEENNVDTHLRDFIRRIVYGVFPRIPDLDEVISRYAPEWPMDQVATIDRNILRIAVWEIAIDQETPIKVAINEAVELGKEFGSESTPRFVNGVLGSLVQHNNEIIQALAGKSN